MLFPISADGTPTMTDANAIGMARDDTHEAAAGSQLWIDQPSEERALDLIGVAALLRGGSCPTGHDGEQGRFRQSVLVRG